MKAPIAALVLSLSPCLWTTFAAANERESARCIDVSIPKGVVAEHGGRWIELTLEQWQFLRGVYALSPETPIGLPCGDKAALVEFDGSTAGLVFFIDGHQACTPIRIPRELLDILSDVAAGKIEHDTAGL